MTNERFVAVLPAAGIDFALYEYLRRVYREKVTALEEPSKSTRRQTFFSLNDVDLFVQAISP